MTDPTLVPQIDVGELARRREQGAFVLDVREPYEYHAGHVPGAVLMPLGEVVQRHDEVPTDEDVYVICLSGGRSARAVEFLNASGHRTTNVAGGTKEWIAAGFPVNEGDHP
jgi:rhodanese-related sulfurtransferase